jgi:hypothetical protein
MSLKDRTKLKGLLEIVSSSAEFEIVPIRRHEEQALRRIYDRVPVKVDKPDYEAPHFKTFVLLQAHFSRIHLPPDLQSDLNLVLEKILNLLSAAVDVMSSNAWLSALGAMDLSQMCVQACWETDSHLKQIPHFESDVSAALIQPSTRLTIYLCRSSSDVWTPVLRQSTMLWNWTRPRADHSFRWMINNCKSSSELITQVPLLTS